MKFIYIAGPLFTEGDRWYLENIDLECKKRGFNTYLPHRDGGLCLSDGTETPDFFESDRKAIDKADYTIAILHGQDIDSGTAWEIGYSYAKNIPIIAIADDIRIAGEETNINLMISNSTNVCYTMTEFLTELNKWVV